MRTACCVFEVSEKCRFQAADGHDSFGQILCIHTSPGADVRVLMDVMMMYSG